MLSAGADGLVKLWGVRTSECVATFDEHEAKVWAMHVAGTNDSLLVTGGADARVNVWRDCTAEIETTAAAERSEAALKGQELANALQVSCLGRTPFATLVPKLGLACPQAISVCWLACQNVLNRRQCSSLPL